jgi:hypothetical protein
MLNISNYNIYRNLTYISQSGEKFLIYISSIRDIRDHDFLILSLLSKAATDGVDLIVQRRVPAGRRSSTRKPSQIAGAAA